MNKKNVLPTVETKVPQECITNVLYIPLCTLDQLVNTTVHNFIIGTMKFVKLLNQELPHTNHTHVPTDAPTVPGRMHIQTSM
jgi:hypothetical protein